MRVVNKPQGGLSDDPFLGEEGVREGAALYEHLPANPPKNRLQSSCEVGAQSCIPCTPPLDPPLPLIKITYRIGTSALTGLGKWARSARMDSLWIPC